jgi:hypothetical protein
MDWTTLGSVLGSNFFIAVVSLATARWQINNAKEQLDKQLQSERERAQRERRREIRSEPLLKLRGELALAAAKAHIVLRMRLVQDSSDNMKKVEHDLLVDLAQYVLSGELRKTLYSLDEPKIIDIVSSIMGDLVAPLPSDESEVNALITRAEDKILKVQSLINKRLEEL